jgi:predicted  nucleic acid-binding Zn-ribbon protein
MSAVSLTCPVLSTRLLQALSSATLQGKAWDLGRGTALTTDVGCRTYAASLHGEFLAATISSVLNLAITGRSEELSLPPQLIYGLITRQRNLPHLPKQCSHAVSHPNDNSVSLFQQESTPFTGQHLQDWRNRLKSELESQNSYQRHSIVRSVAQICQDLETRCNTVEEPLRREKAQSHELEQRVEELSEQVSSLESQAADYRFHLDGLEDEKIGLADEKDRISAKLDELRVRFEEANRDADEALRNAREEFNARELELRSTILNHEEHLQTREATIRELNGTLSDVRNSSEHKEEELRTLGERYEDLQTRLGDSNRQLDDERKAKSRQSEDMLKLKERGIDLEHQLQNTESELEAMTGQLSNLEVSHQELKQSSGEALRDLEARYTADMEASATRAREERDKLNSKLTDTAQINRQLKDAHDKTRRELHALQNTFSTLETKAQELDVLCGEQEGELEDLRTLRRNVLASMGLATQNPLAIRSASRSQKDETVPETPRETREHRRRKSAIQTQDTVLKASTAAQGFTNTAMENVAEASFAASDQESQNGSTPKRQKPRPSFKVPTMQTPFNQRPALASRSTSKKLSPVKRSALRQMSPNRRHTTVGFAGVSETEVQGQMQEPASTGKRRGSLRGASQEDFDVDDFLAGTPFTPGAFASGTGRLPEDNEATMTEL